MRLLPRLTKACFGLLFFWLIFQNDAMAQYSTRYALLVGIGEYPKESGWPKIHGDRDVQLLAEELKNHSFLPANTIKRTNEKASRELILASLEQIQQRVQSGDIVYIHFSGHFQQITDQNGEETDGLDECFAAWDSRFTPAGGYNGEGHLRDDELAESLHRIEEKLTRIGQLLLVFDGGFGKGQRGTSLALNFTEAGGIRGGKTGKGSENDWADLNRTENSPHTVSVLPASLAEPVNETVSGKDSLGTITAFMREAFRNSSSLRSFGDLVPGLEKLRNPRVMLTGSRDLEFWPRELSKRKEYTVDVAKNARLQKDSRVFAVCIGVSKYPGENRSLRFAHSDAASFFSALQQVYGEKMVSDSSFLLLNDHATQARVFQLMDRLKNEIRKGDRLYFYFAGHGDVEGSLINKPTFFLLPGGSELSYSSGGHIPFDLLRNYMNTFMFKGAQVYMVVDACHSGNLAGGDEGLQQISNNLKNIDRGESVKILACGPNEKSKEGDEFGGGFGAFTWYLLRGMEGRADYDRNNEISVAEIGRFLSDSVSRASYQKQNPLVEGPESIGFLPKPKKFSASELAKKKQEAAQKQSDQATLQLEQNYRERLKKLRLVEPAENCALFWLEKLEAAAEGQEEKKKRWREELSDAINTKTQTAINLYIAGNENIVREEVFRLGARELAVFLEHNPPRHSLYPQMLARRYFFEAQALSPIAVDNDRDRRQLDSAINHLRTALQIESRAAHLHNAVGRLYWLNHQLDSAIRYFNQAIVLAPRWKFPYNNKGGAYQEKIANAALVSSISFLDSSIISYQKAIQLDSRYGIAILNLGRLQYRAGRSAQAKQLYQKAIFLNRKDAEACHFLADVYKTEQNWDSAYYVINQGLTLNPDDLNLNLDLANVHYELAGTMNGTPRDSLRTAALSLYRKVFHAAPGYPECLTGLMNCFADLEMNDSLILFAEKAISLNNSDTIAILYLIDGLLRLNRTKEAGNQVKLFEKQLESNYTFCELSFQFYTRIRDFSNSFRTYRKAISSGSSQSAFDKMEEWVIFKKTAEYKKYKSGKQ